MGILHSFLQTNCLSSECLLDSAWLSWKSHVLSAQEPHVASSYCVRQCNLHTSKNFAV